MKYSLFKNIILDFWIKMGSEDHKIFLPKYLTKWAKQQ